MFYKFLYHPTINRISRNIVKTLLPSWKWKNKIPVSGKIRVSTEEGRILMATNPTSYATKHIFWKGIDQFEYVPIFIKLIQEVDTFIDIGANTGVYSLLGCLHNKTLQVHAFEPSTGPFEYLKKNIRLNNFEKRISCFQIALSNANGQADFHEVTNFKYKFLDYNLGGVGNLSRKLSHRHMTTTKVEVNRLDDLIDQLDVKGKLLIKIDTEATEDAILEGMDHVIEKYKPIIICETLYGRIEPRIEKIMKRYGYLFYNHIHEDNGLSKVSTIVRKKDNNVRDCFMASRDDEKMLKQFT